jgi:hypothetical protein
MDPLTIALAIYGGYQGYKSAKKSGAGTAGKILGTALGAYGGYSAGTGITGSALGQEYLPSFLTEKVTPSFGQMLGINAFNPAVTDATTSVITDAVTNQVPLGNIQQGIGAYNPELASFGADAVAGKFQPLQTLSTAAPTNYFSPMESQYAGPGQFSAPATPFNMTGYDDAGQYGVRPDYREMQKPTSFLDQAKQTGKDAYSYLFEKQVKGGKPGEKELDIAKTALFGVPALAYASGAFEREPFQRNQFTYNVNYPELYRSRKMYVQDPKTGEVRELEQQAYIPEEKAKESITSPEQQFGPYKRETITLQQGGLATLNHFRDGGVSYLPSKTIHDEDDEDNYIRTNGYVEDGAGNGDKEEDTMLAQLADGEFVTRTDGVLGAGILAGANPKNAKEMRKLGAEFFYEQQKRFKRIYDLLDASRKATAH